MVDGPSGASIAVCSGAAPDRQGHRFVPHARRLAVALVALLGLVVTVLGAWLAFTLGTSGMARFTATASEPLVIGPSTLNRVAVPVTVSATSRGGPVFLGVASPQDAAELISGARHQQVVVAEFPARTLRLATSGDATLADPTNLPLWRTTGRDTLVVSQDNAPESVVIYPGSVGPVDVTLTWTRNAWFLQSVVVLIAGLVVLALAAGWLWRSTRSRAGRQQGRAPRTSGRRSDLEAQA